MSVRERIVGTALGRAALYIRTRCELVYTMLRESESIGTLANDHQATLLVTQLCKSGMTFIDVGAHIGSIISAVQADPSVSIIGIEAIPDKVDNLRRRFPKIELHECAVGDQFGEIDFFVNTLHSGYSSLLAPQNGSSHIRQIRVPMRRLDEIVTASGIDVIKIDVEGAELLVMKGAERLVCTNRPTITFESGPLTDGSIGVTKQAMWRWLNAHNYLIFVPNRLAHNGPALSLEGFIDSHYYPRRTTNYFAVAAERRLEIRDAARRILGINFSPSELAIDRLPEPVAGETPSY